MSSKKRRLYVALYAREGQASMPGGEDKYHWSFVTGPRNETDNSQGRRIHAREWPGMLSASGSRWEYESRRIAMGPAARILVRVVVGKIESMSQLTSIMETVPMRGHQPGWNGVEWLREALELLEHDGKALGESETRWPTVRDAAMEYAEAKAAQHRFDGKAKAGRFDPRKVATYDLLNKTEIYK